MKNQIKIKKSEKTTEKKSNTDSDVKNTPTHFD